MFSPIYSKQIQIQIQKQNTTSSFSIFTSYWLKLLASVFVIRQMAERARQTELSSIGSFLKCPHSWGWIRLKSGTWNLKSGSPTWVAWTQLLSHCPLPPLLCIGKKLGQKWCQNLDPRTPKWVVGIPGSDLTMCHTDCLLCPASLEQGGRTH